MVKSSTRRPVIYAGQWETSRSYGGSKRLYYLDFYLVSFSSCINADLCYANLCHVPLILPCCSSSTRIGWLQARAFVMLERTPQLRHKEIREAVTCRLYRVSIHWEAAAA